MLQGDIKSLKKNVYNVKKSLKHFLLKLEEEEVSFVLFLVVQLPEIYTIILHGMKK